MKLAVGITFSGKMIYDLKWTCSGWTRQKPGNGVEVEVRKERMEWGKN